MKHGGIVGVIDHVALPGDTRETADKLHRVDPQRVKADFEAAGSKLVAHSNVLANPQDDHLKLIMDPTIKGQTDRFVFKFVKD
jgi:predicted methyltransferase